MFYSKNVHVFQKQNFGILNICLHNLKSYLRDSKRIFCTINNVPNISEIFTRFKICLFNSKGTSIHCNISRVV